VTTCEACSSPLLPGAIFCGECGGSTRPRQNSLDVARTDTRQLPIESSSVPEFVATPRRQTAPRFSDEPTLPQPSFLLRFSNGTSVSVTSGGLLGRNPVAASGDVDDHLIIVTDPDRTVSKTHLEFGIEAGDFWICDRFSGNGTTVCEPGQSVRRLIPGRHYRIFRGTVVGIGEQAFTLL